MLINGNVVVEVDGPQHYYFDVAANEYRPNGSTLTKQRQIRSVDNMHVVNISVLE